MSTELITFKMDSIFLSEVDKTAKDSGFHNRTEFIRSALREKIDEYRMKQAMLKLTEMRGKAPRQTTDEERAKIREQVFNSLI